MSLSIPFRFENQNLKNYRQLLNSYGFKSFLGVDVKKHRISATSGRKLLLQCGADSLVPSNFMSKLAGHKVEHSQLEYMR